jgi:hypothetical protein
MVWWWLEFYEDKDMLKQSNVPSLSWTSLFFCCMLWNRHANMEQWMQTCNTSRNEQLNDCGNDWILSHLGHKWQKWLNVEGDLLGDYLLKWWYYRFVIGLMCTSFWSINALHWASFLICERRLLGGVAQAENHIGAP